MRIEPDKISPDDPARKKAFKDKITRIIAIILSAVSVYFFFFKLLFL